MTTVTLDMSMSLDGFVAGPNDDVEELHGWLFNGDTSSVYNDMFRLSKDSAKVLDDLIETTGAIVAGRRTYDLTDGWGGSSPFPGVPMFVVSHASPSWVPQGSTPFTFVTDGVESAISQARAAAGQRKVYVLGGASIAHQCLQVGLVDEMTIHLVPILLRDGLRLFEGVGRGYIKLEPTLVTRTPEVTHLSFRVRNRA
jgi:dihydrofolate reductase